MSRRMSEIKIVPRKNPEKIKSIMAVHPNMTMIDIYIFSDTLYHMVK